MIREKFYGHQEHFLGWKCIYCGEIVDHLILENRQSPSQIRKERRNRKIEYLTRDLDASHEKRRFQNEHGKQF